MKTESPRPPGQKRPSLSSSELHWRWRLLKDKLAAYSVAAGGVSVIFAVVLIFFYFLYVVFPLFLPATVVQKSSYQLAESQDTLHLALEEQHQVGVRIDRKGYLDFIATDNGRLLQRELLMLPEGRTITTFAAAPGNGLFAVGLDNGTALVARYGYRIEYRDRGTGNKPERLTLPEISFPLGEKPLDIDPTGHSLTGLALESQEESTTLVALNSSGESHLLTITQEESFLSDEIELQFERAQLPPWGYQTSQLLIDSQQRQLYLTSSNGYIAHYDISDKSKPVLRETIQATAHGTELTAATLLTGGISLVLGTATGELTQWFPVRDQQNRYHLTHIRTFESTQGAITALLPEQNRKGFAATTDQGTVSIYYSTANRRLLTHQVGEQPLITGGLSPMADALALLDRNGTLKLLELDNPHPEISWSALWGAVWYESYPEPDYIWQSSSASNDFEPKLSLTPLAFGTFKAMFYAMLMALPIALLAAIFTAYFMAPQMRTYVKPVVEIMAALPTVILGFLAGLWLAPFIEARLPGLFTMVLVVPTSMLLFGYLWHQLPATLRGRLPDGWEGALLIPVAIASGWAALAVSQPLEFLLFDGNLPLWLNRELGIPFDQRNSIVVGLAMGFAVIPTIFSIAEDAVFSVPKSLSQGSLALGATRWQTLTRVVLLTASPGIFSAVMIGMGRAVGETMIVLMATGNTPVMDMSIFQGMRTLAANIAVEMGEAELLSTHYRVLFLAGLVLFAFTFAVNTVAELVRQRLRARYSNL